MENFIVCAVQIPVFFQILIWNKRVWHFTREKHHFSWVAWWLFWVSRLLENAFPSVVHLKMLSNIDMYIMPQPQTHVLLCKYRLYYFANPKLCSISNRFSFFTLTLNCSGLTSKKSLHAKRHSSMYEINVKFQS